MGAAKWITLPSSLNMFTSSMAWMGWTLSFFREPWSFLSSVPEVLWTFFTFRLGVPLPLYMTCGQQRNLVTGCPYRRMCLWTSDRNLKRRGSERRIGGVCNVPYDWISLASAYRKATQGDIDGPAKDCFPIAWVLTNSHRLLHLRQLCLIHICRL